MVATGFPILGRVTAGLKTIAVEDIEGYLQFDHLMPDSNAFALRVKGDSMENAGIFEGDIIIVSPAMAWTHGDIVVALVEDMATVKRLVKDENQQWWLEPCSPKYSPIPVSDDTTIVGKVVAVIRRY
ncbi:hypothetical protein HPY42_03970 [Coprothermobacteraceae bacterium]|nr:hypothetical protein [Coprothermobacteraceae bacterium]